MKLSESDNGIESLISQHKAARLSTLEARRQFERAEAAEHSLLLSIEAWAESQGFDIRLLDEAEEKPELVVTDWRDLRVGDVISWTSASEPSNEWIVSFTDGVPDGYIVLRSGKHASYSLDIKRETFKFIRRPAK